jgi:hypothetical protein
LVAFFPKPSESSRPAGVLISERDKMAVLMSNEFIIACSREVAQVVADDKQQADRSDPFS